jgi:hypothetical protein
MARRPTSRHRITALVPTIEADEMADEDRAALQDSLRKSIEPTCKGRMKLVALLTEPRSIARFLTSLGEPTDVPARSPNADVATAVLIESAPSTST